MVIEHDDISFHPTVDVAFHWCRNRLCFGYWDHFPSFWRNKWVLLFIFEERKLCVVPFPIVVGDHKVLPSSGRQNMRNEHAALVIQDGLLLRSRGFGKLDLVFPNVEIHHEVLDSSALTHCHFLGKDIEIPANRPVCFQLFAFRNRATPNNLELQSRFLLNHGSGHKMQAYRFGYFRLLLFKLR